MQGAVLLLPSVGSHSVPSLLPLAGHAVHRTDRHAAECSPKGGQACSETCQASHLIDGCLQVFGVQVQARVGA